MLRIERKENEKMGNTVSHKKKNYKKGAINEGNDEWAAFGTRGSTDHAKIDRKVHQEGDGSSANC